MSGRDVTSRTFIVALCGFSDNERKVLGRAFSLSQIRPQRYQLWEQGQGRPHLYMVNEDLAAGAREWAALCQDLGDHDLPVIRIGISETSAEFYNGRKQIFFKRPILASRILKTLDDLVSEVYNFTPDLVIHDNVILTKSDTISKPIPPLFSGSRKRILVVDDSESVRKLIELKLTKKGYVVDFAVSGEEGLMKAGQQIYDLIFLDVMLPGISGYDVARHLKRDFRIKSPVVILTSKSSRIDKLKGALASADAYLTKPLTMDGLEQTLRRFLS